MKTTTTPSSTRKLAIEAAAPQPKPQPTPAAVKPAIAPLLSDFQENLAMLIGDMIVHGGRQEHVDQLLDVAIRHQQSQQFGKKMGLKTEASDEPHIYRKLEQWRMALTQSWCLRWSRIPCEGIKVEKTPVNTFADRVEENIREQLWDAFESFLHRGTALEMWLLHEILVIHENRAPIQPSSENFEQPTLPDVFMSVLNDDSRFIKVPKELREATSLYVASLLARDMSERAETRA